MLNKENLIPTALSLNEIYAKWMLIGKDTSKLFEDPRVVQGLDKCIKSYLSIFLVYPYHLSYDDMVQEMRLNFCNNLPKYDPDKFENVKFETFAIGCLINHIKNYFRNNNNKPYGITGKGKNNPNPKFLSIDNDCNNERSLKTEESLGQNEKGVESQTEQRLLIKEIFEYVEKLSDEEKKIFTGICVFEEPQVNLAKELGVTRQAINDRYHRILKNIKYAINL